MAKILSLISLLLVFPFTSCSRNVDWVKERAQDRWNGLGYEVVGYEGYQWSLKGGSVWYLLKRPDSPGILYTGYLERWFDEVDVYNVTPVSGHQVNLVGG